MGVLARLRKGLLTPVHSPDVLHQWLWKALEMNVPRHALCPGHDAPFDYLCHAYFEPARDLIVWAPRGGGKTRLGAAATLLDLLHKPGIQVRILGGSFEQSLRMWEHLFPDLQRLIDFGVIGGEPRQRKIQLASGSAAGILTQSQRAVRGLRVQKLRCDEVELFDPAVWEAAQLVTRSLKERRSADGLYPAVAGAVEAVSTLHNFHGLMQRIVESAERTGTRIIRWCLLEVLEKCPPERECASCPLWEECRGVAKTRCDGYFSIDDAIAMKSRVSVETWESEILCRRPSVRGAVFPTFDPSLHVTELAEQSGDADRLWLGVDFGFSAPFVSLFIRETGDGVIQILDEYVQPGQTIDMHITQIQRRWGVRPTIACDPAGSARNEQTAQSNVAALRQAGFRVKCRKSLIQEGLELVRNALRTADGKAHLFIHPRCQRLIRALRSYRYPEGGGEVPFKDGAHDHLIDALRYYFVNRERATVTSRRY